MTRLSNPAPRASVLVALLCMTACAAEPIRYATDGEGHMLPRNCRAEPESVTAPVLVLPRASLQVVRGSNINGYYHIASGQIAIASDLTGWRRADTIRHEQFHAYCQATRDPCCTGHFAPVAAPALAQAG